MADSKAVRESRLALPEPIVTLVKGVQRKFSTIAKRNHDAVNWPTEYQFALQAMARNTLLQKCDPGSIADAMLNVAAIGLSLNPQLQHCALIPRYDTKRGCYLCHADPMYKGLIALGTDSGSIVSVRCEVVREADQRDGNFHYQGGTEPRIHFAPNPFGTEAQRGPIIGAFAISEIPGARHQQITMMSIEQIVAIREKSESWKYKQREEAKQRSEGKKNPYAYGGPWEDHFEEMAKKTVIKRASKTWPKRNERYARAEALSNEAEGYTIEQRPTDIEGESVQLITKAQLGELHLLVAESHVKPEKIFKRFRIEKLEEMPMTDFATCRDLLRESKLIYALRTAAPGTEIYAEDYGLTLEALEGKAANENSRATLRAAREKTE